MNTRRVRLQQLRLRENQLFLVLTIIVGILAGLAAVLFTVAIEQTSHRLFGLAPSQARLFLVPPIVSVVTGILLSKYFNDARGSGVPQTKAAYHLTSGEIPGRVPFGKFVMGVLTIGAGHSMGREGPSVQIGAGIASAIGRWFQLRPGLVQRLVPVGAAGALAAAFNTPIAAVVFVLEEIIGDLNAAVLGSTIVASVSAVVVERSILGNEPLFHVPPYHLVHPAELIAYAALGLVGGILSVIFCKFLLRLRKAFLDMPQRTRMFQPAIGGLIIGAMLIFVPGVMGVGYDYVDQALNGGLILKTMVLLCLAKLTATVISYTSGNAGGIFAPSLFIGAMAGGAVGYVVHQWAPFPTGDPGAYALVGMGALFAGIVRAPLTSVFMIFELTQDYQIVVPLMAANLLSYTISKKYQKLPVYEALLVQDNVHLPTEEDADLPKRRVARQLMQPATFIAPSLTIGELWESSRSGNESVFLIGSADSLAGTVSKERLAQLAEATPTQPLEAIVDGGDVHVHPDHSLDIVLERFSQTSGLLPVVSRSNTKRVEGVITLDAIVQFLASRRGKRS